jgi:hypothetical protein
LKARTYVSVRPSAADCGAVWHPPIFIGGIYPDAACRPGFVLDMHERVDRVSRYRLVPHWDTRWGRGHGFLYVLHHTDHGLRNGSKLGPCSYTRVVDVCMHA